MIPKRKILVGVLAAFAVLINATDTLGWWRWSVSVNRLYLGSTTAAADLVTDPLVALPSFVARTRRLRTSSLAAAPRETVVAALARLGTLQTAWMPGAATGFTYLALEQLLFNRPDLAVPLLEEAVLRDPHSSYIRRLRGLIFLRAGDRPAALEELAFAEAVAPGSKNPVVELAPEDQALVRLRGLEIRRRLYPRQRNQTALALARLLRSDGRMVAGRGVLDELAGHPEIDLEIARWEMAGGNLSVALDLLGGITSRERYPRGLRARAWSSIAVARDQAGEGDGALEAAAEALRLDPDSTMPYVALATLAERRGDHEVALGHLRRAWGMSPADVGLLLRIARVAEKSGKPADALLALNRAVELAPDSPEVAAQFVAAQLRQRRFAEAAVSLSLALDRFPTHPGLLNLADRLRRDVGIR